MQTVPSPTPPRRRTRRRTAGRLGLLALVIVGGVLHGAVAVNAAVNHPLLSGPEPAVQLEAGPGAAAEKAPDAPPAASEAAEPDATPSEAEAAPTAPAPPVNAGQGAPGPEAAPADDDPPAPGPDPVGPPPGEPVDVFCASASAAFVVTWHGPDGDLSDACFTGDGASEVQGLGAPLPCVAHISSAGEGEGGTRSGGDGPTAPAFAFGFGSCEDAATADGNLGFTTP